MDKDIDVIIRRDGSVSYPNAGDYFDDDSDDADSNDNQTEFEQQSNDNQTLVERYSDGDQMPNTRRSSQTAAALACRESLNPQTPSDYIELYGDVVELLRDRKFVKDAIGRGKPKYIFSIPKELQRAINKELGENLKPHVLNKIHYSNEYTKRFSPLSFWSVVLTALILSFGIIYYYSTQGERKVIENVMIANREGDSLYIESWAKKRNFQFYEYRYGLMLADSAFIKGNKATRENIMKSQMQMQIDATAKKQVK